MSILRPLILTAALTLVAAAPAAAGHSHKPKRDIKVQLLSLNDFHGHLLPATTGGLRPPTPAGQTTPPPAQAAGGAAFVGSYVRELERTNRNTMLLSAGDLIGASPLLSALYHDEPTIEAMNLLGLDFNAVGNHEFDEGADELRRMQEGGCHPTDGCKDGDGFKGARFGFLAANVISRRNGRPFFRPYAIRSFDGIKVGIIGMTLEGTPNIVSPAGIRDLQFLDEAETANRYARELRRRHGVKAIVVLLHEGGAQNVAFNLNTINSCEGISGPIVDIVGKTTKAVDLFITGHTHQAYNCVIDGRPVTSASSFGRLVTDLDLTLGRHSRDVKSVSRNNIPILNAGREPVPDVQALIDRYDQLSAPLRQTPVGRISTDIKRDVDPDGSRENAAGNLIADAQLADTDDADRGAAVAALMNPGGVRQDFTFTAGGSEGDGVVTYEEAFTVQPFNNIVATQTLTGAELLDVLKDQWCTSPGASTQASPTVLLPSSSLHYTYDLSIAADILGDPCAGAPNPVTGLTIGGVAVDPAAEYRITTNNFLADGGDGFFSLTVGRDRTTLDDFDIDSLVRYLEPTLAGAPIGPPALDRIDVTQ